MDTPLDDLSAHQERLDNLAFTTFPEDYLPYTSSYHRKAPYLVWDDGFRPHRKRRLKRWRESRACRCCTAAALTAAISLIIIGILSIVAVSIYLGVITSLFRSPILALSGKMSIVDGDEFVYSLLNTTSYEFLAKAETYKSMLENIYLSSSLEPAFVAAKVYAFRKGNLTVFFRIYLDRRKLLHSDEETVLIARNVILEQAVKRKPEFSALVLDLKSIEFRENSDEEQTPDMDFDFHEESKEESETLSEETEQTEPVSHSVNVEDQYEHLSDVQNPASAETSESPKTVVKEDNALHGHLRTSSESTVNTPSHILEHEKIVLSEHPRSEGNVSIAYGQWQPLVPPWKSIAETSSTRPLLKEHRRVSGSGSVHLVEDLFIPVISQTPATHSTPLPNSSDSLKPHPNVASTIMSSVSLVIRPSSKNRTVMVTNNKNNVIETAIKLPTQQVEDSRLHERLHVDSEKEPQTAISSLGTRNNHASLRYIEDFDKSVNLNINIKKNNSDTALNESSKVGIPSVPQHESSGISKETSKLNSQSLENTESQLLTEISGSANLSHFLEGHDDFEKPTHPSEESDLLETSISTEIPSTNTISTEIFSLAENSSGVDIQTVHNTTKTDMNFTDISFSQNSEIVSTTESSYSFSYVSASVSGSVFEAKTSTAFMPVTAASKMNSEDSLNSDTEERLHSVVEYSNFSDTATDILLTNLKFYNSDNDSDSSGFLDLDSPILAEKVDNPKINVTVVSDTSLTAPKIQSFNYKNGTFHDNELNELFNDTSIQNVTDFGTQMPSFIGSLSSTNEGSDLANDDSGGKSTTFSDEVETDYHDSDSVPVSIDAVETNTTLHQSTTSVIESASNGSGTSDLKPGGLPKIVPPFSNTQYIPNDIHSDTDIHKNHLDDDDEKLFPVTFSSVDVEFPEIQTSDKPQTGISKDLLNNFQPPDDENVVIHHITTPLTIMENDSAVIGLGKYPTYFMNKCSNDEIACRSGECIPADYQCNMRRDCRDNSDEDQCSCIDNLKVIGQTQKICDGIQDCWDFSDEENCPWCSPGQFICPLSKLCIEMNKVCDGSNDCPFGTDERYCVKLANDEASASSFEYRSAGYLMIRKQGQWGKLCLENLHNIAQPENLKVKIGELGHAVCSALSYKEITEAVETKDEIGTKQSYFEISPQSAKKQSQRYTEMFQSSDCQSKSVVRVICKSLECGVRPMAFSLRRRIVGGHSTNSGSWPWQVALYKEGDFQCGAVLVSDVWLISAGHCFYSSQNSHWTARLGVLRRGTELPSPSEQVRRITHIFIHPDYIDKGFINDIALLRMESPVPFSDFLRPLCLPNKTEDVSMWHDHHCSVVGWGKLYEIGHTFPDSLQEVQLPVISTEECRKKILFLTMYHLTENMFCAGYERGGRDACLGDSGGPLMCQRQDGRWVLLGVTSNGDGCGRPGRPGVYTKVTNYLTWINQVIDGDLPPQRPSMCAGHRCSLGHCVLESKVCDGRWDCSDGSDETNCFT